MNETKEQKPNEYIFGLNLNNSGYDGIVEITYNPKTDMKIFCLCTQVNSEIILKAMTELSDLQKQLSAKDAEIEELKAEVERLKARIVNDIE